jgi:hypothetical protein
MIRTFRAYFLGRLLREKLLLLMFVLVGVLIWLSSFASQAGAFWSSARATTTELKEQDSWLARRTQIETTAQKAAAKLDASKTLDGVKLYAEVVKLANDTGVKSSGFTPGPDLTDGQFSSHTLNFSVSAGGPQKEWLALQSFYTQLRDRAPYIGINQATLTTRGTAAQAQHVLALTVSSVEIVAK